MKKILLVDDEKGVVAMMKSYFEMSGYQVLTAYNGAEALRQAVHQPDIILLDINMPGMDGLIVCEKIRSHISCPILFLTARIETADKIKGFQVGADDYIIKPFDIDELGARVAAHLRRENRKQGQSELRFFSEMVIDYSKREVSINGTPVNLSKKEFDIVELLSLNAGQVFDRERIYEPQPEYEKGAYVSAQSPYRDFFHFFDEREEAWPYNKNYDGWWGHDTLPKLNYEDSPTLEEYILNIGKKWVSPPYNADGWRLDVAADLGYSNEYNHIFWENFRKAVKSANPQALILAEHYGDPGEWLQGDEWDSVMNYDAFMEPLTWFLTGMEKHSDERRTDLWGNADNFVNTMNHFMASMLTPSLQVAMNELSNHDHSRFLTRTNHIVGRVAQLGSKAAEEGINLAVMREAVAVQMTWVGAPTVYYGDEAGVCGFTDPDSRRTYPWGQENRELVEFHKEMIRIHKREKPLRTGSLKMLSWSSNVLAYARFQEGEQIIVVLNNSKELKEVTIPVWQAEVPMKGKMERLMYSWEKSYTTERDIYLVEDGETVVNMGKHSVLIMKPVREMQVDEYGKESSSN